ASPPNRYCTKQKRRANTNNIRLEIADNGSSTMWSLMIHLLSGDISWEVDY
ncbi:hypothetical protein AVEN_201101-1, partial [Araneus ventricosus]